MAQQIKKKFIGNDQIDSTKIKLLQEQSIRGTDSNGSEVELIKLGSSNEVLVKGQEVSLKSELQSEESARIAGDADLQSQIDNIVSNVDPAALDSLTEIVEAFQNADSNLNAAITALGTGSQSALAEEIARAQAAEADLQLQIDTEESSRISADQGLQSSIDTLSSDLSQEVSDRQSGDSNLQSQIDSEVSSRQTLEGEFDAYVMSNDSALAQEVSDRVSGDNTLQSNIDTEVSAREMLEGEFDAYVISNDEALAQEISDRSSDVETLHTRIDTVESEKVSKSGDTMTGMLRIESPDAPELYTQIEFGSVVSTGADAFNNGFESNFSAMGMFSSQFSNDGSSEVQHFVDIQPTFASMYSLETPESEVQVPFMPSEPVHLTTKAYVDQEISALSSGDLAQLQSDLEQEISDREALEGEFDAYVVSNDAALAQEVSDRMSEDSNLQSQIDTEKGRIDAILDASQADKDSFAEIVQLINSIDTENDSAFAGYVLSNDARSTQIESDLSQETSDRISGDQTLQSNIDVVSGNLSQEISDRQTLESEFDSYVISNNAALAQEVSDRQVLEGEFDAYVISNDAALAQEISDREAAVESEELRALAAESVLQDNIDSEEAARIAGDNALQAQIDALDTGFVTEEELSSTVTSLQSNIDSVNNTLTQEISDRQTLEGEFDAYVVSNDVALAQEVSDRMSEDSILHGRADSLQSEIDAEEVRAMGAEADLQSQIDAESSARQSADEDLDSRVSVLESVVFFKEKFVLTSTDISNGFVTLSHTPESSSMSAFVDRLAIHEGASEDYSISGTTMTFLGSLVSPGQENLQVGDTIYVKYQYKM